MTIDILIPYNFTINDVKSIDFVEQRYGSEEKANITLFHAYTPVPEIDITNNPIMEKITHQTAYLRYKQKERRNALWEVRQKMMDQGFNGDNINCIFIPIKQDIAVDIINLVESGKFNIIVLNNNPGNILNYFSRSISKRLTQYFGRETEIHIVN